MSVTALSGPALSEPLRLLQHAVTLLAEQRPASLSGAQALAETAILLRELDKLSAVSLHRLADVDARELHDLAGAPSTRSWLEMQHAGVDPRQVALARRMQRMPGVADALRAGVLSLQAAQRVGLALEQVRGLVDRPDGLLDGQPQQQVLEAVVVDGVLDTVCQARGGLADDDPEVRELHDRLCIVAASPVSGLERLEHAFVEVARRLEPHLLRGALGRLVDALLPVQLADRADRAARDRGLQLRRKADGSGYRLEGDLDLECGELLFTVLQAARETDPDNPADTLGWAARREEPELAPAPRSRRAQEHDALRLALRRLLDGGLLGVRDKHAPHLLVTVGLATLHGAPGALPAVGGSGAALPVDLVQVLAGRQPAHPVRPGARPASGRAEPHRADAARARAPGAARPVGQVRGQRVQPSTR